MKIKKRLIICVFISLVNYLAKAQEFPHKIFLELSYNFIIPENHFDNVNLVYSFGYEYDLKIGNKVRDTQIGILLNPTIAYNHDFKEKLITNYVQNGYFSFVPRIYNRTTFRAEKKDWMDLFFTTGIKIFPTIQEGGKSKGAMEQWIIGVGATLKYKFIKLDIEYNRAGHNISSATKEYFINNIDPVAFFSCFRAKLDFNILSPKRYNINIFTKWNQYIESYDNQSFYVLGITLFRKY